MFIIVIIIIIKSTRLDSIDYKSAQRGVARGGGRGEHSLAKSIECYKWLKNLWALRSHDKHPTPSPSPSSTLTLSLLSRLTLCLTRPRGVAHAQRVHKHFSSPLLSLSPSLSLSSGFPLLSAICKKICPTIFEFFLPIFLFVFCLRVVGLFLI